jgi:hypothetical protein
MYLINPCIGKRPRFKCLKELLEFVDDRANGFVEYVSSLQLQPHEIIQRNFVRETSTLREQVFELEGELEGAQLRLNLLPGFESQILLLKAESVSLNERLHNLSLQDYISQVEK